MTSSISPPSPFDIPYIENAKLVKLETKPFLYNIVYNYTRALSFENEPYNLETIPVIREHMYPYLIYFGHRSTISYKKISNLHLKNHFTCRSKYNSLDMK